MSLSDRLRIEFGLETASEEEEKATTSTGQFGLFGTAQPGGEGSLLPTRMVPAGFRNRVGFTVFSQFFSSFGVPSLWCN